MESGQRTDGDAGGGGGGGSGAAPSSTTTTGGNLSTVKLPGVSEQQEVSKRARSRWGALGSSADGDERRDKPKIKWGSKLTSSVEERAPSQQPAGTGTERKGAPAAETSAPAGVTLGELRQLVSSLGEFRADLTRELQKVGQRIGQLETAMVDVSRRVLANSSSEGAATDVSSAAGLVVSSETAPSSRDPTPEPGDSGAAEQPDSGAAERTDSGAAKRTEGSAAERRRQRARRRSATAQTSMNDDSLLQRMLEDEIVSQTGLFTEGRASSPEEYL